MTAAAVKAKQKKQIHDLHQQYYGGDKGKKPVKEPVIKDAEVSARMSGSRADLMEQVRLKGVKNFRVMNKAELAAVLGEKDQKKIDQIVAGAVARWKSGWGTKSREAGCDHKE